MNQIGTRSRILDCLILSLLMLVLLLSLTGCTDSRKTDGAYQAYMAELNRIIASARPSDDVGASGFAGAKPNQIVIMKPGSEITDEIKITGAILTGGGAEQKHIETCAKLFVESNPHVKIVLDNYEDKYAYSEALSVLLMTDNFGDIVLFPDLMKPSYLQESKFFDLMPYIEDPEKFEPEDYFMNIILAERNPEGKLLALPAGFYARSRFDFLGSLSEELSVRFETDPNFNIGDVIEFYVQKKGEMGPDWKMCLYVDFHPISYIGYNFDSLVDFKKREARFTDPEFMEQMERIKEEVYVDRFHYTEDGLQYSRYGSSSVDDLIAISDKNSNEMLREIFSERSLFPLRTKVRTEPRLLPNLSGNYPFVGVCRLAIGRKAKNPDLAWEFIRFLISEKKIDPVNPSDPGSYQTSLWQYSDLCHYYEPINRANFKKRLKLNFDFTSYIHRYRSAYESLLSTTWEEAEDMITDFFVATAEKLNYSMMWFGDYFQPYEKGIIWDEMYLYLSDLQSVEQTMQNIENKIKIMLNE